MTKISAAVLLCTVACGNAFVPRAPTGHAFVTTTTTRGSSSSSLNLNIPRVALPDAAADKLAEFDLKNPNDMSDVEYNGYSGAAIGGTLAFFVLPGAVLTGILGVLGSLLTATVTDFALSAAIGGGLAIYLSLRSDEVGATLRNYGGQLYDKIKEAGLPVVPRQTVPDVVGEKLGELGLLSINDLDEEDYDGYAGAAVAGTLAFFLLPGLFISGLPDIVTGEFVPKLITDFLLSAITGGGVAIYLSLRKDELGDTVSEYGGKLVDAVGNVLGDDDDAAEVVVVTETEE